MAYSKNIITRIFKPTHPEKYRGDPSKIYARSSWELRVMKLLDTHPSILKWASEEFSIPYTNPLDKTPHKYYPDFYVEFKTTSGLIQKQVWEVKPKREMIRPEKGKKKKKTYLTEMATYYINQAKWRAAETFCQNNNLTFKLLNEYDLGIAKAK